VGIGFTIISKNVQVKRVVFPVTLIVVHVAAFFFIRSAVVLSNVSPVLVGALLGANVLQTMRIVRFCEHCGRTIGQPIFSQNAVACPTCRAANVG